MRKGKDPDPYLWLTDPDPDPWCPKTSRSGSPTLQETKSLLFLVSPQMFVWKGSPGQAAPVLGAHRLRPLQANPSCLRRSQHQHPDKSVCQAPSQLQPPGQCRLLSPSEGVARNGTADDGCSRQHGGFPKTKHFYLAQRHQQQQQQQLAYLWPCGFVTLFEHLSVFRYLLVPPTF